MQHGSTTSFSASCLCLFVAACGGSGGGTGTSSSSGPGPTTTESEPTTTVATSSSSIGSTGPADSSGTSSTTAATTTGDESSTGGDPPSGHDCSPPSGDLPPLRLVPVVTGIPRPIAMAVDPSNPSRFFLANRVGLVRIIEDGVALEPPFLDLSGEIETCCSNDAGFLGLVAHPDYANNGRVFVNYTPTIYSSVLQEFVRSEDDPNLADPTPVRTLLAIDQDDYWHYGGTVLFGPDGMLWYSRGDGGGMGDPEGDAQNPLQQLGKVMRFDVDTFPKPPPGNLPGADPYVHHLGLRNVWRMTFDPCTDDLYLADVGQAEHEEINVAPAGSGPLNFGWNAFEGPDCFAGPCGNPDEMTFPITTYNHNQGECAVVGGHVYRGHAIPAMRGRYFYGDACSRRVWSLRYVDGAATDIIELSDDLESEDLIAVYDFASFGEGPDHELYVLDMGGTVYRIEAE